MQSNFDAALSAVLKHEGGYVDHPQDPGGATNKGITLATFRRYVKRDGTKADLKKLTTEQASIVYRRQYWDAVLGSELPSGIDYAVFDFGVNSGPARAVRELQKLLGAKVDGVVGPQTLAACRASDADELIIDYCAARFAYLQRLKTWPTFGKGWTARVAGVRMLALKMAAGAPLEPAQPVPVTPAPEVPSDAPKPWWAVLIDLIINFIKGLRK
jgi:lysozyme family protein